MKSEILDCCYSQQCKSLMTYWLRLLLLQYKTQSAAELNAIFQKRRVRSDQQHGPDLGQPPDYRPNTPSSYDGPDTDSEYKPLKKVKEHSVDSRLSVWHPTTVVFCPGTPKPWHFFFGFACPTKFLCRTVFISLMMDDDEDDNSYVAMLLWRCIRSSSETDVPGSYSTNHGVRGIYWATSGQCLQSRP
jgi:hypothetical protein